MENGFRRMVRRTHHAQLLSQVLQCQATEMRSGARIRHRNIFPPSPWAWLFSLILIQTPEGLSQLLILGSFLLKIDKPPMPGKYNHFILAGVCIGETFDL